MPGRWACRAVIFHPESGHPTPGSDGRERWLSLVFAPKHRCPGGICLERDRSRLAITVAVVAILLVGITSTVLGILTLNKVQGITAPSGTVPATTIIAPTSGSTLSRLVTIDARPIGPAVVGVDVLATGGTLHDTNIGTATLSLVGWQLKWATNTVANGTYSLVSVGYNSSGQTDRSFAITVTVKN